MKTKGHARKKEPSLLSHRRRRKLREALTFAHEDLKWNQLCLLNRFFEAQKPSINPAGTGTRASSLSGSSHRIHPKDCSGKKKAQERGTAYDPSLYTNKGPYIINHFKPLDLRGSLVLARNVHSEKKNTTFLDALTFINLSAAFHSTYTKCNANIDPSAQNDLRPWKHTSEAVDHEICPDKDEDKHPQRP